MKRLFRFTVLLTLLMNCHYVMAYSFYDVSPSGDTLYYQYLGGDSLAVVHPDCDENDFAYFFSPWIGHTAPEGNLIIPDSISRGGYTYYVRKIGERAFSQCPGLTSVVLPNTLREIGEYAFFLCWSLHTVTIPESVTQIKEYAFNLCDSLSVINCMSQIPPTLYYNNILYYIQNDLLLADELTQNTVDPFFHVTDRNTRGNDQSNRIFNIPCGAYDDYVNEWGTIYPFVEPVAGYRINLSSNDTTLGNATALSRVRCEDTSIVIYAEASAGCHFGRWSNGRTANPDTIHLAGDSTIIAIFARNVIPEICLVSVESGHNTVVWDNEQEVQQYNIYRESFVAGEYELAASVPYSSASSWTDSVSRPSTRSYRYRMTTTDIFGYETASSGEHKTMHLTISQGLGGRWNLQWTPYEGAEYTTYIIYRGTSSDSIEQIDIMPADGNTSYTDETVTDGDVYYQVGIVMTNSCTAMDTKSTSVSLSNIATNSTVGIYDISIDGISVYTLGGQIVVETNLKDEIGIYDIVGRKVEGGRKIHFDVPASGMYFVKIGTLPAQKVVVVK